MYKHFIHRLWIVLVLGLTLTSTASAELIAWWKFDDGAGTTAADSSGNGHDGTLTGDAAWAAGQLGGALQLDGSGDYVTCGLIDIDTAVTGGLTVCAWINKSAGGDMKFCSNRQGNNAAGGGFTCTVYNNRMEMDFTNATARNLNRDTDGPTVPADTWVHLAWVYDDVANTFNEYHDGVLADSSTENVSIGISTQEFRIGADAPNLGRYVNGLIDDLRIYDHALSEQEILAAMAGRGPQTGMATDPIPAAEQTDVPREVTLSWTPGEFADKHDVYLGTVFSDVNDASRANPLGVLASQNQDPSVYTHRERLALGQTYYWRVDEVNAPPDSTVFKGDVWSFTTEPVGYAIDGAGITATASSVGQADFGPEKTIDGSGLDDDALHSTQAGHMWLSGDEPLGAWIQYEFDKVQKLHQMWVWNSNQIFEPLFGFGMKDVTVEYSTNGADWTALTDVPQFTRAPGTVGYAHDTTVDFGGVVAKYVKLTASSNWGGVLPQYSLSEVRFFSIPVRARGPSPESGAADVGVDATLTWRAGREAATHDVYLSTDEQAVIDGNVPAVSVTDAIYSIDLDLNSTYYWRVDEVNDVETPTVWPGDVWSLSTPEYLVVDDFEDYNDYPGYEIYSTWLDGYEDPANGSQVGNLTPPLAETTIVRGGAQSMPLFYSNAGGAASSEATRTFAAGQDWTKYGIQTLSLYFYGTAGNTGQLYVKINGVKVPYDADAANLAIPAWQPWNIDLTASGANLTSVTTLTIGIDGNGAAGTLYFDDLRLYPYSRQLVTPVEPDPAGLAAHWPLDGTYDDSSGNARHGTPVGGPIFGVGKISQALGLDGVDDYVTITGYKGVIADRADPNNPFQRPFSVTCWINTTDPGRGSLVCWGSSDGTGVGGQYQNFQVHDGRLRAEHGNGRFRGAALVNDGEWHHVALTVAEGADLWPPATQLYVDGRKDSEGADTVNAQNIWNITEDADVAIGMRASHVDRFFTGMIDDARIYERVLTHAEIAGLAGRMLPFDEPF